MYVGSSAQPPGMLSGIEQNRTVHRFLRLLARLLRGSLVAAATAATAVAAFALALDPGRGDPEEDPAYFLPLRRPWTDSSVSSDGFVEASAVVLSGVEATDALAPPYEIPFRRMSGVSA